MGRRPFVPPQLLRCVFSVDEARHAGIDRWHLEGASWARVGPSLYVASDLRSDAMHRIEAARRRLPSGASFSGLTAAWLHGLDVDPCNPIEATVEKKEGVSARTGIALRRSALRAGEVIVVKGVRATSIPRTIGELGSRLPLMEAVVVADQALHSHRIRIEQLKTWADSHAGHRGIQNLRSVLSFVEPAAESPMESRLRMVLVLAGLPRPQAQVTIRDRWGRVVGRPDLYYERQRLGIEYDGGMHRDKLAEDNRRQNRLLNAGVRLLRFTAGDVLGNPAGVVRQVSESLSGSAPNPARGGTDVFQASTFPASAGTRRERTG